MNGSKWLAIVLTGLMATAPVAVTAAETSQAPGLTASALPPGVNPSSPTGDNGGNANGDDNRTPPLPTKADTKKVSEKAPGTHSTTMQNGKPGKPLKTKSPRAKGQQ